MSKAFPITKVDTISPLRTKCAKSTDCVTTWQHSLRMGCEDLETDTHVAIKIASNVESEPGAFHEHKLNVKFEITLTSWLV